MTSREYFEKLKTAATDGTFPSVEGASCRYRTKDGRACAIGIILTDKMYRSAIERWDLSCQTPGMRKAIVALVDGATEDFMLAVQHCHDGQVRKAIVALVDGATEDFMLAVQHCHDGQALIWNPEEFIADVRRVFQKFGLEADEPGRAENAGSTLCGQTVS